MSKKKEFNELDVVKITGIIAHCYRDNKAVEVEIIAKDGHTMALFTVYDEDLDLLEQA